MATQAIPIRKVFLCVAGVIAATATNLVSQSALLLAPATPVQTPTVQAENPPAWEATARSAVAGGKMEFDVASVREDPSGKFSASFSMDSNDDYTNSGGLFTADLPLSTYINFAYKLDQMHPMTANLPQWVSAKHFEIQARAAGSPTKDQMRLMMQALLADRFKLALHFERQETPVLIMTLIKPGKMGPRLRLHADGPPCDVVVPHAPGSTVTLDMFRCGVIAAIDLPENAVLVGARNTTSLLMGAFFTSVGHLRPIVDRTGIRENIDFSMEYSPPPRGGAAPSADAQAEVPGITFEDAVKDQLGLKLESGKEPLVIPVVDHVEMPSEN